MDWIVLLVAIGVLLTFIGLLIGRGRRAARRADITARQPVLPPADLAPVDDDAFRARVMDELDAGRKIEAIRLVRERTRLGLAEAKALVEALAAGDDSVDITGSRDEEPGADVARVALDDPDLAARLVVEIAAGRRIEAIKLLRERTGLGLKEAKDAIESLEREG